MPWPEATDYNEAVQNPALCFQDPDLRDGRPELNALGWPLPCSGNFAAVYRLFGPDDTSWAVKCFTREVPGLRERYHAISAHLQTVRLPFMVDFQYLQDGIRIRGDWYPVLKMRWVEGLTLNAFLKDHADKPQILERLSAMWQKLARELRRAHLAHADLQHGNVLLIPGGKTGVLSVRLIDYDGMYVPALARSRPGEVGHANFQHPDRAGKGAYDAEIDRFPHLVIYTALRALAAGGRALWDRHDNGENLLFREPDFTHPDRSAVFKGLWQGADPAVRALVGHLVLSARGPIGAVPLLAELVEGESGPTLTAAQERQVSEVLGPPGVGSPKPRTAAVAGKKTAAPEAAATVAPTAPAPQAAYALVGEPEAVAVAVTVAPPARRPPPLAQPPGPPRRPPVREPVPAGLDPKILWGVGLGAGALVVLLVVVGLLIFTRRTDEPAPPPPVAQGPLPVDPGPVEPGPGDPAQLPKLGKIPELTLHPGDARDVEVAVERRGYEGPIELRVRELPNFAPFPGGVRPAPKGMPGVGPLGPPRGMPMGGNPAAPGAFGDNQLVVAPAVTIPKGRDRAALRVKAGANLSPCARAFEVRVLVGAADGPPAGAGGPFLPGGPPPAGAGGPFPPGAGGMPGGGPPFLPGQGALGGPVGGDDLVTRFTVTVRLAPRSNPEILPVAAAKEGAPRELQVNVLWAAVASLDYDRAADAVLMYSQTGLPPARDPNAQPVTTVRGHRLVVVSATFPYREQLERFRKALHAQTVEEVLARPDTRLRFLGLNVLRREQTADGGWSAWAPVYRVHPDTDVVEVTAPVRTVLNESFSDPAQTARHDAAVIPGAMAVLPRLASGAYPKLILPGIPDSGEAFTAGDAGADPFGRSGPMGAGVGPRGGLPGAGGGGLMKRAPRPLAWVRRSELPKGLQAQLDGKASPFDLLGGSADAPEPGMLPRPGFPGGPPFGGPAGPMPGPPGLGGPMRPFPGAGGMKGEGMEPGLPVPDKCLVRFFDAGVIPGKTYQYSVQVCLANPNHGKHAEVQQAADARARHLVSPAVLTPPVAIGEGFEIYAVDQWPIESPLRGPHSPLNKGVDISPATADLIPVQVHRWLNVPIGTKDAALHVTGWVIAERLLVRRGEPVGRRQMDLQAPGWSLYRGVFELAGAFRGRPTAKSVGPKILADMLPPAAPVVVDFTAGNPSDRDDAPIELLLLGPDGTLRLQTSRADDDPDHARGRERRARYEEWRQQLRDARQRWLEGIFGVSPGPAAPGFGP